MKYALIGCGRIAVNHMKAAINNKLEIHRTKTENAQRYVERLEELAGVRISIITVGPDRDQTILRGW